MISHTCNSVTVRGVISEELISEIVDKTIGLTSEFSVPIRRRSVSLTIELLQNILAYYNSLSIHKSAFFIQIQIENSLFSIQAESLIEKSDYMKLARNLAVMQSQDSSLLRHQRFSKLTQALNQPASAGIGLYDILLATDNINISISNEANSFCTLLTSAQIKI